MSPSVITMTFANGARKAFFLASALILCFSVAFAQGNKPVVELRSQLSRTAIWVGDTLEYRITLICDKNVEVIRDNLKKENLNLEPFILLDLKTDSHALQDGRRALDLVLALTTLDSSSSEAKIPSFNIYYATRRRGLLGKGAEIETHTLVIPEKKVGLRSTLTSDSRDIMDAVKIESPGPLSRMVWLPGWILMGLVVIQVGVWSVSAYRRKTSARRKLDKKGLERHALSALGAVSPVSTREELPERYSRISQILRNTIKEALDIDAASLTPEELHEELLKLKVRESLAEKLKNLLAECDAACYAPMVSSNGARELSQIIGDSREVIASLVRL